MVDEPVPRADAPPTDEAGLDAELEPDETRDFEPADEVSELRERVTSVLMRIELRPDAPLPSPDPVRVMDMRHPDPAMAELEMAGAGEAAGYAPVPMGTPDAARRAEAVDPNDPGTWARTPRNAPCPCGSGKKYKHCHGRA